MLGNCRLANLFFSRSSFSLNLWLSRRFYRKFVQNSSIFSAKNCKLELKIYYFTATAPRRFYKKTSVLQNENCYEVALDHRKLKTPAGKLFTVRSEPLAIAVATEFDHQKEFIERPKMHLSALCFTAIDNPSNLSKDDMTNYVVNYLDTDTILFQGESDKDLCELQCKQWDPLIDWFNRRYETDLLKTGKITLPQISERDKSIVRKYLQSNDEHVLHGRFSLSM